MSKRVDWEQMRELAWKGMGLKEIAKRYGIAEGTVYSACTRQKWELRKKPKVELVVARAARAEGMMRAAVSMYERGERVRERAAGLVEKLIKGLEELPDVELVKRARECENVIKSASKIWGWDEENPGRHATIKMEFGLSPEALERLAARERRELEAEGKVVEGEVEEQEPGVAPH